MSASASAGRLYDVGDTVMAFDTLKKANSPQWLPSGDQLLLNMAEHP
jgi:hypothetical protein